MLLAQEASSPFTATAYRCWVQASICWRGERTSIETLASWNFPDSKSDRDRLAHGDAQVHRMLTLLRLVPGLACHLAGPIR